MCKKKEEKKKWKEVKDDLNGMGCTWYFTTTSMEMYIGEVYFTREQKKKT